MLDRTIKNEKDTFLQKYTLVECGPNWMNENRGIWWYYIGWNGSALGRTRKSSFFAQWWPVFSSFLREICIVIQSNDGNTHLGIKLRRCQFRTGREDWERIQWIGLEKGERGEVYGFGSYHEYCLTEAYVFKKPPLQTPKGKGKEKEKPIFPRKIWNPISFFSNLITIHSNKSEKSLPSQLSWHKKHPERARNHTGSYNNTAQNNSTASSFNGF